MSIEQIIILILFVVIPIFQALRRKWEEVRQDSLRTRDVEEPEIEPAPYSTPLPDWTERSAPIEVYEVPTPPSPAPRSPPPAPALARPEPPAPRSRRELARPAPLRRAELVPPDRDSLRRVMALMAIFGPPRALDPYRS